MSRGVRKSIEEKITMKEEVIRGLEIRLKKEKAELDAMLNDQKVQEVESLYDFIKTSNLSVCEATEILKQTCIS